MSFVAVTGSLHSCETPHTVRQRYTEFEYYLQMSPYTSVRKTFYRGPDHFFNRYWRPTIWKPLEQNESDTGNMQPPYNSPGDY